MQRVLLLGGVPYGAGDSFDGRSVLGKPIDMERQNKNRFMDVGDVKQTVSAETGTGHGSRNLGQDDVCRGFGRGTAPDKAFSSSTVSLIVPCYNEQESLGLLYGEMCSVVESLPQTFEFIFVDDGSSDETLQILQTFAREDSRVRFYSFSRNFGKEAAMYAGLLYSRGDFVAIMDADMQDPPSLLPEMLHILETTDCDSVATRRAGREGEPRIRSFFARAFYKLVNKISDADIVDGARDFRLMRRNMVDAILKMTEVNRFSKGIFGWVGFKTHWLSYENVERCAGETKWSFWKLAKYAVGGIVDFSSAPLMLATWVGLSASFLSFVALVVIVVRRLVFGDAVAGWASQVCVVVFMGGIQLLFLGVLGQYIARIYTEAKHRPVFIVARSNDASAADEPVFRSESSLS